MGVKVVLEEGKLYGKLVLKKIESPRPDDIYKTKIWCDCECGVTEFETTYRSLQGGKSIAIIQSTGIENCQKLAK